MLGMADVTGDVALGAAGAVVCAIAIGAKAVEPSKAAEISVANVFFIVKAFP